MIERQVSVSVCKLVLVALWGGVGLLMVISGIVASAGWMLWALLLANFAGVVSAVAAVHHIRLYFVRQSTLLRALHATLQDDDELGTVRAAKFS